MLIPLCFLLQAIFMCQFLLQILQGNTYDSPQGYGIILQQNSSVLILQDLYENSWKFPTVSFSTSPTQNLFNAIEQVSIDTEYSAYDFRVFGPPCIYGKHLYWYATLDRLDPPQLKNLRLYKDIQFIPRETIRKLRFSTSYDVDHWIKKGMRYSCRN